MKAAFEKSGENQVRAARALGITRNTLRTLLKRHGRLADGGSSARALPLDEELRLPH